jgi:hypothetical protein
LPTSVCDFGRLYKSFLTFGSLKDLPISMKLMS